jgi:hypothetical protein
MPGYVYKGNKFDVIDEPLRRGAPFDPERCGTTPGYRSHIRWGIPVCTACREANNAYDREQGAKRRARMRAA